MTRRRQEWSPGAAGPVLHLVDLDPDPARWWDFALCAEVGVDPFFMGKGGNVRPALAICAQCPVQPQCLEDVLEWEARSDVAGGPYGVVGGKTANQRRRIQQERRQAA